ncbi:hypothetical protein BCEP4_1080029 [Burkholderia cepacia]|nr:hypothetical protein BCEP4_1080029 [Burkholderia cepacia]
MSLEGSGLRAGLSGAEQTEEGHLQLVAADDEGRLRSQVGVEAAGTQLDHFGVCRVSEGELDH